jgi:hypothetical protein
MTSSPYEILDAAVNVMVKGPAPLDRALKVAPELAGLDDALSSSELLDHLRHATADDPLRNRFRSALVGWDYQDATEAWTGDTVRNTESRRQLIYTLLGLAPEFTSFLDESLPFARLEAVIVIADKYRQWYSDDRRHSSDFYWSAYRNYLKDVRRFAAENLETLDEATTRVVERLTDPEQKAVYQSKGLVVGYVQSGKTANFTGVIAKAIDAGYRLVIVLSGTMDLLRDQTQRRVDMELVGKEQIRRHASGDPDERFDYDDDPDWEERFLAHGGRPSEMGSFDILRLTGAGQGKGSTGDYQSLKHGIQTLEIEKIDKRRPLHDPANLHSAAARLMVVKKNPSRLLKLVTDLKKIGAQALSEVPALIIDDESDQASVNTIRPDVKFREQERRRRTTINQRVTDLLSILPRAQYVGYTATPFANVLVDPDDEADIFPKDFIVSLPRPSGYMGVAAFQDIEPLDDDPTPANSNEKAFVRGVWEPHDESTDLLLRAIDTFVLTGAIKLYRERLGAPGDFRHHTMLVHESQRQADHEALSRIIDDLWARAGYDGGEGLGRLRDIFREDVGPVSDARADGLPTPDSVDDLRRELGEAIRRIESGGRPLLLVNGTKEADTPNFDKIPVWKIIVGGAKLSRGYTVEGLTVSYFRRRAAYQDTLMQMGRWFGFRPGYTDLVRLFIGRHEPLTSARRRFIDLYEAFGSICLDEEAFRAQLHRYAMPEDGSEPLTPRQVPPFVMNTHPQLTPVAPNKMFNAILKSRNFGGEWVERTMCTDVEELLRANAELFADQLRSTDLVLDDFVIEVDGRRSAAPGYAGLIDHAAVVDVLGDYRWAEPNESSLLTLELEFLRGRSGDPEIDDWVLYLPQLKNASRIPWQVGGLTFTTVERSRVDGFGRFKAFTEPRHRHVAEVLTGRSDGVAVSPLAASLARKSRRGALVLYPVHPPADEDTDQSPTPTMGFAFLPPSNRLPRQLQFRVRDPKHPSATVV